MKYILLFLFFISSVSASELEERRKQILKIIDEEISEVNRLTNQSKKDPDLFLRLAELNLEKARLWRESENQSYLKIPEKKRRKINRKKYFQRSNKYFNRANKVCLDMTRRFKGYKRIGEVYYILGFNAKESNDPKRASKYLSLAARKSKDKKVKLKTQVTLAEVYYNQKRYSRAIPLYERSLSAAADKWWTKDSFNLAWCYFQKNQYAKAISKMKEVYKRSSSSKYIDMRSEVERDLGLFFATSGKIKEGISFYQDIKVDFSERLIYIAQNLISQGQFDRASTVLDHAIKYEKGPQKKDIIYLEQLYLYERDNKMSHHEKVAKILFDSYRTKRLNSDQIKRLKYQLEKVAANLQRQVIGKTYKRVPKVRKSKARQAIHYFGMLSLMDAKKSEEFRFLKAETAYAAGLSKEAYEYYKDSFLYSEKLQKSKFKSKAMDGMLVVLATKSVGSNANNIFTFEAYLRNWSRGKKAKGIYSRLFNNYMEVKNYEKAKEVLDRYSKAYPKDYKTSEAMIAKLMDVDRKKGNNDGIRSWISMIDAGKYKVSGKFARKLKELLTTIQIEDVQKELGKGNKKTALVGYLKILDDPYSTKRSKINAKYNLSALYYELGDADMAYKWSISALDEMEVKDALEFSGSFITIANFLFTSLEFDKSADLSEQLVKKTCKQKFSKKNTSFKNAVFIYLADGNVKSAESLVMMARKCRISKKSIELAEFELMRAHRSKQNWTRHEYYVEKLARSKYYKARMIDEYLFLMNLHRRFRNPKEDVFRKKAWRLFYTAKKEKESISMDGLDYFASSKLLSMEKTAKQLGRIKYIFPEKLFADRQKKKLSLLEKLTSQASDVQAIGSGVGIVNSFKLLHESYIGVAEELKRFTPDNKTKEYIAAFKKDMLKLAGQIEQAADQYKQEAKRAINNNAILNKNNFFFQETENPVMFYGEDSALLMDRGGMQ